MKEVLALLLIFGVIGTIFSECNAEEYYPDEEDLQGRIFFPLIHVSNPPSSSFAESKSDSVNLRGSFMGLKAGLSASTANSKGFSNGQSQSSAESAARERRSRWKDYGNAVSMSTAYPSGAGFTSLTMTSLGRGGFWHNDEGPYNGYDSGLYGNGYGSRYANKYGSSYGNKYGNMYGNRYGNRLRPMGFHPLICWSPPKYQKGPSKYWKSVHRFRKLRAADDTSPDSEESRILLGGAGGKMNGTLNFGGGGSLGIFG